MARIAMNAPKTVTVAITNHSFSTSNLVLSRVTGLSVVSSSTLLSGKSVTVK